MQPSRSIAAPQPSYTSLFLMKKAFLVLGTSLLLAGSAHAQFGVRVGGNAAIFTKGERLSDENPATNRQIGYQLGLYYQVPLTKYLALVPEVQFSRERFHVNYTSLPPLGSIYFEGPPRSEYNQSLSYLNLPILLRANLGPFYLEAGPQLGLLVGGRAESSHVNNGISGNYVAVDAAATASYRRFDAGPCVGLGLKLPAGLGVGLRAYWGLTQLTDDEHYSASSRTYTGFRHRQSLQASLTYQLLGH
jgi:hypothetical protein